jgi:CRISPR system Cascade subunit CasE
MAELYLSLLTLNPRSRQVQTDLRDSHQLHRTLMRAFGQRDEAQTTGARDQFGVLHRLEPNPRRAGLALLVQSAARPDWSRLPAGYAEAVDEKRVEERIAGLRAGQRLRFRLRANPTKRVWQPDDPKKHGKRVELRDEETQRGWLVRKGERHGFRLLAVSVAPGVNLPGVEREAVRRERWPAAQVSALTKQRGEIWRRPDGAAGDPDGPPEGESSTAGGPRRHPLTHGAVIFDGVLEITDVAAFRAVLAEGIGSGKAYGFGLLSVARLREG